MENEQYVKIPGDYVGNVFGSFDENIKALEKKFAVSVINRGDDIIVAGEPRGSCKGVRGAAKADGDCGRRGK